jgi:RNA polymerase sigma-70 factor (ECF subfamily)
MARDLGEEDPASAGPDARRDTESSAELVLLAQAGDRAALDRLMGRYFGPLRRRAAGRLPRWARDLCDTDDLVQESLLHAIRQVPDFEVRHQGAFHAYLRKALDNRIRDEIKKARRHPRAAVLFDGRADPAPSPLEEAIGRETLARYESALERLDAADREVIVARVELGLSYHEIAEATRKPSPDAARMAVSRALVRLAEEMGDDPR